MGRSLVALVAAMALAFGGAVSVPAHAGDSSPSARGSVKVAGKALGGARVEFAPVKKSKFGGGFSAKSSKAGKYKVKNLTPGAYRAKVSAGRGADRNFLTTYYGNTVRLPDAKIIKVGKGAVKNVNISAKVAGRITGTVVLSDGKPAHGVSVRADAMNRHNSMSPRGSTSLTDAKGRYEILSLPADRYRLLVGVGGRKVTDNQRRDIYSRMGAVTVKTGKTAKAKKITISVDRGTATVTGRVVIPASVSKGSDTADKIILRNRNYETYARADSRDSGRVVFKNIPAGTYRLVVPGANYWKTVKVGKGKTKSFGTIERPKGTKVFGSVRSSTNKPIKTAYVKVVDANGTELNRVAVDAKGRYSISGIVPGRYTVYAFPGAGGKYSWILPKIPVVKKGKNRRLNFVAAKPASIRGKVVDSKGKPVSGILVRATEYVAPGQKHYSEVKTDSRGNYAIKGLPRGQFKVQTRDPFVGGYFHAYYKGSTYAKSEYVWLKKGQCARIGVIKVR